MSHLQLTAYDPSSGQAASHPMSPSASDDGASIGLRCVAGTTDLHVLLSDPKTGPVLRAEIEARGGEEVVVRVRRDAEGELRLAAGRRRVWLLPPEPRYAPPRALSPDLEAPLDLLILLDATARTRDEGGGDKPTGGEGSEHSPVGTMPPLWSHDEAKAAHVDLLVEVAEGLAARQPDLRVGVLAFADAAPPGSRAHDLLPSFRLRPAEGRSAPLRPYVADSLRRDLLAVPASSGGDFVDALGDALAECNLLHWREGSRRLVLLSGDSPGFSVLDPPPPGADALVRSRDVDVEARRLHEKGVELVTLYHDLSEQNQWMVQFQRDLLRYASRQYARLASHPGYAFRLSSIDAGAVVGEINAPPPRLARGACLGEMAEAAPAGG